MAQPRKPKGKGAHVLLWTVSKATDQPDSRAELIVLGKREAGHNKIYWSTANCSLAFRKEGQKGRSSLKLS